MKFERKIYLGFAILVIAFLPIVLAAFFAVGRVVSEQNSLSSEKTQALLLAERLRYIATTQSALMPVFVLTGDMNMITLFEKENQEFNALLEELVGLENEGRAVLLIAEIQNISKRLHALAVPGIRMRVQGHPIIEVNEYFSRVSAPVAEALSRSLDELVDREAANRESARQHVVAVIRWVMAVLIVLSIVALVSVVLMGRLMVKVIRQKRQQDESQKILMEKERRLSQARKETVEVVAHDLKNPVGTIKMSVEMMLSQLPKDNSIPHLRKGLEITQRSAASMENLIHDLLDHAKIEADHLILEKQECDLTHLIDDLIKRFEPLALEKKIDLASHFKTPAAVSICDPVKMEQVLSNLIGNALKFTPAYGRVLIELKVEMKDILISVEDSGSGIEADQIPHIFERFWQVRETAKEGTGLGLAIAKAIVDAHHGKIWVESERSKGSRFYVCLPLARSQIFSQKLTHKAAPEGAV